MQSPRRNRAAARRCAAAATGRQPGRHRPTTSRRARLAARERASFRGARRRRRGQGRGHRQTVRRELFGDDDPLGQTIRIGNVPFTVIGVLEREGPDADGQDQDDVVVVPVTTTQPHPGRRPASSAPAQTIDRARPTRHDEAAGADDPSAAAPAPRCSPAPTTTSRCATSARSCRRRQTTERVMTLLLAVAGDLAGRRRHRHHEHHAGVGHRAHARDRLRSARAARHPPAVPRRGDADLADRRRDRHRHRHRRCIAGRQVQRVAGAGERERGGPRRGVLDRDRVVLRGITRHGRRPSIDAGDAVLRRGGSRSTRSPPRSRGWRTPPFNAGKGAVFNPDRAPTNSMPRSWKATRSRPARSRA